MIEEGAKRALKNVSAVKPYVPARPTTIKVETTSVDKTREFFGRHGVTIVGDTLVESRGDDWMQAWDQIWSW